MKCPNCKEWLIHLGALLGGIQIWGCKKCRRTWWKSPDEKELTLEIK